MKENYETILNAPWAVCMKKFQEIWHSFTSDCCESLVATMPTHIRAVIKAKEGAVSY